MHTYGVTWSRISDVFTRLVSLCEIIGIASVCARARASSVCVNVAGRAYSVNQIRSTERRQRQVYLSAAGGRASARKCGQKCVAHNREGGAAEERKGKEYSLSCARAWKNIRSKILAKFDTRFSLSLTLKLETRARV